VIVFLGFNGMDPDAPSESATAIVLGLAAGEISEEALANWIAAHIKPLDAPGIVP
jgi:death-on-curing protein